MGSGPIFVSDSLWSFWAHFGSILAHSAQIGPNGTKNRQKSQKRWPPIGPLWGASYPSLYPPVGGPIGIPEGPRGPRGPNPIFFEYLEAIAAEYRENGRGALKKGWVPLQNTRGVIGKPILTY